MCIRDRGEIIAGLLIGPRVLGLVQQSDFLIHMAEIGVIMLMFSAGLETNLRDLMIHTPDNTTLLTVVDIVSADNMTSYFFLKPEMCIRDRCIYGM